MSMSQAMRQGDELILWPPTAADPAAKGKGGGHLDWLLKGERNDVTQLTLGGQRRDSLRYS